jgi:alpha-beta hydrolase superfamily lysophospholipase
LSTAIRYKTVNLSKTNSIVQVYYYWIEGSKPDSETILVLPGLDESITDYQDIFEKLKIKMPGHSILAIDLRGQGQTLKNEIKFHPLTVSIDQQNYIISEIVNELSIKSILILGLSYGAGVGLYFANRSEKVKGLFLLSPYVSKFKNYQPGFTGLWYSLIHLNPFYRAISFFTLPFYFQVAKNRGRLNPLTNWDQKKLGALTKLSTGIMQLSTTKEVENLRPLNYGFNILIGEKDDLVSISAIKFLMNKVKMENKSLLVLPNLGHRLIINHSEECSNWISGIIKENKNKFLNLQ